MLYEEKVDSFPGLEKRLRSFDQDEGVRILGRSGGRKVLVFVTRSGSGYLAMTYAVKSGGAPGKRLQAIELDGAEEVIRVLRRLTKGRLRAWIY